MARLGFTIGNIFRETGIALERLGSRAQGDISYADPLSRHKEVRAIFDKIPSVAKGCFIAPTATVVGSVKIGSNSNVWYGAVVKGDDVKVAIGENTNIKESAVVGTSKKEGAVTIGNNVSIGAGAIVGAATVEDNSSVGAGASIADGAHLQKGSAVADGAVVLANTTIPSGQLFAGTPAKFLRNLTSEESAALASAAAPLLSLAAEHLSAINKPFREIEKERAGYHWKVKPDLGFDAELGLLKEQRPELFTK
mmetsp:Transcript_12359/g.26528  ORF Transcript_12359/g.26528 Transcript_12359/m.26528 type:complete len:252 (-) Transcript_12359:101-856(-)